jgi:hypothetical protein
MMGRRRFPSLLRASHRPPVISSRFYVPRGPLTRTLRALTSIVTSSGISSVLVDAIRRMIGEVFFGASKEVFFREKLSEEIEGENEFFFSLPPLVDLDLACRDPLSIQFIESITTRKTPPLSTL